jgi:hypothetical protein
LLAHELTHVVQQAGDLYKAKFKFIIGAVNNSSEQEAKRQPSIGQIYNDTQLHYYGH